MKGFLNSFKNKAAKAFTAMMLMSTVTASLAYAAPGDNARDTTTDTFGDLTITGPLDTVSVQSNDIIMVTPEEGSEYDKDTDSWTTTVHQEPEPEPEPKPEPDPEPDPDVPEADVTIYTAQIGQTIEMYPGIISDGNGKTYEYKWETSTDKQNWETLKEGSSKDDPKMAYELFVEKHHDGTYYRVTLRNEAGNEISQIMKLVAERSDYQLLPGMPTFVAGDHVKITPEIIVDGNSDDYRVIWYEYVPQGDKTATDSIVDDADKVWTVVSDTTVAENPDMSYEFYADCEDTFTQYRFELINEAGVVQSKEYEIGVIEDYIIKDGTLYIYSTGYRDDIGVDTQKQDFLMNDYTGRLVGRQPWADRMNEIEKIVFYDHIGSVGSEAFENAENLERVKLSEDLLYINKAAFKNDAKLKGLIVPEKAKRIEDEAFYGCTSMKDLYLLSNGVSLADSDNVLPKSKDVSDQTVKALPEYEEMVKNQHANFTVYGFSDRPAAYWADRYGRAFIPVNDSNGNLIEWNYSVDEDNEIITSFYTDSDPVGEVYIPKSINGYDLTKLEERVKKIETEDNETEDFYSIFNAENGAENSSITAIHIPESIRLITGDAFGSLTNLDRIYNYSKSAITMDSNLNSYSMGDNAEVWIYSPNWTFEDNISGDYARYFFDKSILSGTTGDLIWTLDPNDKTLTFNGSGTSGSYDNQADIPWEWASKYIDTIIIQSGVKGLGKNVYMGLNDVRRILNYSEVLTTIDNTSFTGVGINRKNKICQTVLSNRLYDVVLDINSNDPDVEDFNFTFMDTSGTIGNGVSYTYLAADQSLTITGTGTMNAYPASETPGSNTSVMVPWKCVREYIDRISIESEVKGISNNSFVGMPNLKEVYNYAKNQTIVGGNDNLFDVIERTTEFTDFENAVTININDPGTNVSEDLRQEIMRDIVIKALLAEEIIVQEDDLIGKTIVPGSYTFDAANTSIEDMIKIFTGELPNPIDQKYIVPVYTFGSLNQNFCDAVPQPEEKGYKLVNIYKDQGICGENLTWYISMEDVLVIEGYGDMYDFERGQAPWAKYVNDIASIKYSDKMTSIGNYAFEGMGRIKSFDDIPRTVTRIGVGAFKDCVGFRSFNIKKEFKEFGSGAFAGCTALRILDIENQNNYKLENGILYTGDKSEILGYLRDYLYLDPVTQDTYEPFVSVEIDENVKRIGELSFYKITTVQEILIKDNVEEIADYAFEKMINLRQIRNEANTDKKLGTPSSPSQAFLVQKIGKDILLEAGGTFKERTAIVYQANTDFIEAAIDAGYTIVYLDELDVAKITAVYQGKPVTINTAFDPKDVLISIIYTNGQSSNVVGTDPRITFNSRDVKVIGDNIFHATYNDGYGTIMDTNEFTVEGVNGVVDVEFVYRGAAVWYGDQFNKDDVQAFLTYADKSKTTIKGSDSRLSFDKTNIDKIGDNVIKVTFDDQINAIFVGEITIPGKNFLRAIAAEYKGDPIRLSSGINDLDLRNVTVTLTWADGSSERTDGEDSRILISTENAITNDYVVFQAECLENNKNNLVASFAVPFESDIREVSFAYVGQPVTQNAPIAMGDIELTLTFSDGSTQKVRGDSVSGLTGDPMISLYSDQSTVVNLTFNTEGNTFTGTVEVPGKLRLPVKLTVVQRPNKTVYQDGETFDPDGMVVNCLFDNGEVIDVTERTQIEGDGIITANTKVVTLVYEDPWSHSVVKTNMTINVNANQKDLYMSKEFKEQYEITKILFRSKFTEDQTYADPDDPLNPDPDDGEDEDDYGKWIDITPPGNSSIGTEAQTAMTTIKAGYGFEIKVWTKYQTTRGGEEFEDFLQKSKWDDGYANDPNHGGIADINTKWRYLNDIYPQYTPTANPDILYLRIKNNQLDGGSTNIVTGENGAQDFIVLERTDMPETGDEKIESGEWYDSTKIFEFPLRDVLGNGTLERRLYVSKDAANPNTAYTDYTIQIVSPAWYGYEPEPEYDYGTEAFKYIEDQVDENGNPRQKAYAYTQYLHVCASFNIRVTKNDDVKTHILQ